MTPPPPAWRALRVLFFVCSAFPLASAAAEGALEGRVLNARSGEYLGNARVTLAAGSLEAFTDGDGRYRFPRVPAGRVEVRATFTGLPPASGSAEVGAGRTAVLDLSLGGAGGTVRLDQFVVGASREMDAAALAINEQRFAPNVRQVVATDEFGHVAEGNVGEFVKFLPGVTVEYGGGYARGIVIDGVPSVHTPITIDGFSLASTGGDNNTGRSVQVDMASINSMSRVEVSFSPTPESQGSALAGAVNLVPRSSFERVRPQLTASLALVMRDNARDFHRSPGPREADTRKVHPSFDFAYVHPVSSRFGFTLSGGTARQYTAEDFTQNTWRGVTAATNGTTFPHTTPDRPYLSTYAVRDAPKDTIRRSFSVTMDARLSARDRLAFSFQFFSFNADTTTRQLTFNVNRVDPGAFGPAFTRGAVAAGDLLLNQGGRDRLNRTWMPSLTWRHDGPVWKLEAGVGHSQGTNRVRDIDKGIFNNTQVRRTGVTVAFEDLQYLRPGRITVTDAAGAPVDPYRLASYAYTQSNSIQNSTTDLRRSVHGNARRDFGGAVPLTLKAGFEVRDWRRDLRGGTRVFTFVGADGRPSTAPAGGDDAAVPYFDPGFSRRVLPFGHPAAQWISNERLWRLYQDNPGYFTLNPDAAYRSAVGLSKHVLERISAGYLRGDAAAFDRRLKLVAGVRAEQTNIEAEGPLSDPTLNYQRDAGGRVVLGANGRPLTVIPATNALGVSQRTYLDRGARVEKEYLRLFPSLNASWSVRENLILRVAGYASVGRPDFNQYTGGLTLPDTESPPSPGNRIIVNNAGIKAWSARSVKVRLEHYFEGVGQLSVGAFRRQIRNFFGNTVQASSPEFLALYSLEPSVFGGYDVSTQYNLPGAVRLEGWSVDYRHAPPFLPAWARGTQVFANVTSQRVLGDDTGDFAGFVPLAANWGISVNRPSGSLRLNWNYRGRQRAGRIAAGSSLPPDAFFWEMPRLYVDVLAERRLTRDTALFVNLRNATVVPDDQEAHGAVTPGYARLRQRFDLGALWTIGIKGTF